MYVSEIGKGSLTFDVLPVLHTDSVQNYEDKLRKPCGIIIMLQTQSFSVICRMAVHTAKNRYSDVLCYDGNRVVLAPINDDPTSDYINASHVNSYKQKFGYIACQGPLEQTTLDFWRMVWQENCRVIVMNTR